MTVRMTVRMNVRVGVALVAASIAAGCASGPAVKAPRAGAMPTASSSPMSRTLPAAERTPVAKDWESFKRTSTKLREEITRRAEELRSGPVGNRAVELASLRLAASGHAMIEAGSLDGALEVLERAVSLYGGNGCAYVFLAYVHHVEGRAERGLEFLYDARLHLPADRGVSSEVEGLAQSLQAVAGAG
jgi:hypothetical protein